MNTDHATNFLFAVEQLQFRFSCGVNALGAIHTAMEEGSSSPECYLDGLFGIVDDWQVDMGMATVVLQENIIA